MKKMLVSGCSGFIGMHLCEFLLKRGDDVVGIDNINDYYNIRLKESRLEILQGYDNFRFFKSNICDLENLDSVFNENRPEMVVNLAAQVGVRYSVINPNDYIHSNILGFMNVLECIKKYDIGGLVYASSSSVYGLNNQTPSSVLHDSDKPISIYAATKKANELMAHSYNYLYGIKNTGLRYFTA